MRMRGGEIPNRLGIAMAGLLVALAMAAQPAWAREAPLIAAAGDISCAPNNPRFNDGAGTFNSCRERDTASQLDQEAFSAVLPLGDLVNGDDDSLNGFLAGYDPTWGRFKAISHPVIGNHEYDDGAGAAGYWDYWNGVGVTNGPAGARTEGWYAYGMGPWHLIALNSNCEVVGGCQPGSEQERWLRADLAAHPARCTLAFWHHPRFSSGTTHGSDRAVGGLWLALYEAGAEVVLVGHEHNYERFAPLDPLGGVDPVRGVREFVVGTGGRSHYRFGSPLPGSEARNSDSFGVLQLRLRPTGYSWRFLPAQGGSFQDSGSASCH
jgi:acid phosphatase type 7